MGSFTFDWLSWHDLTVIALMLGIGIVVAVLRCCRRILKRIDDETEAREELHALIAEMKPYLIRIKEHDIIVRAAAIRSTRAASQVQSLLDRAKKSRPLSRPPMPASMAPSTRRPPARHQGTLKR